MDEIIEKLKQFRDDRDWEQFHTPENLAKSIVLEAAELLEHFQWNNEYDKEELAYEIADVMSYCILLSDVIDVDIIEVMHKKIEKNAEKYPVDKARGRSEKYTEL